MIFTTPSHVSINRIQIIDLPDVSIDDEVRGKKAYHLLSSVALIQYARQQAESLKMPADYLEDSSQTRLELPRFVNDCLDSPEATVRSTAQSIARRLGRNLGHILLTLHRGDAINQQARPDWTVQDWENWRNIKRIWLGGGVMSGRLGELIVAHARDFLTETGYCLHLMMTPYQQAMTILGVARYLPATTRMALCFDFGHTSVKRACVIFKNGELIRVHHLSSLPVDWYIHNDSFKADPQLGPQVLTFVTKTIVETLAIETETNLSPHLMFSMAAYVQGGQLLGNGLYATMSLLTNDVRQLLAEEVKKQTGQTVQIHFLHDGMAAATLHAGEPDGAVIVVGTAIGVGFPPSSNVGLRPIAANLNS
jgi:hypothetical protein